MTTETATVHRLAPAVAARLLGVVLCLVAVVILASTLAIAVLDLHTVFLLVPVLLTVAVLVGCWWAWRTRGWVVRMTPEGYRVRGSRGVGVASGRWKDVEDAVTMTVAEAPVVVLRLRDGRTTTIPVRCSPRTARRSSATSRTTCSAATASANCDLIRRAHAGPCNLLSARPWSGMEASPSPVYGARLLSGFGAKTPSRVQIPPPPPASAPSHRGGRPGWLCMHLQEPAMHRTAADWTGTWPIAVGDNGPGQPL